MSYADKFLDPRWQKRRLEVLQRDDWSCTYCGDQETTLHVHHRWYDGEPWEAPLNALTTLCAECHEVEQRSWRQEGARLLRSLARDGGMLSENLEELVDAVERVIFTAHPFIVWSAICQAIKNPEVQGTLVEAVESWVKAGRSGEVAP